MAFEIVFAFSWDIFSVVGGVRHASEFYLASGFIGPLTPSFSPSKLCGVTKNSQVLLETKA